MNRKLQKEKESSCEYILPDYLGDVRKVLKSSAVLVPSGEFISNDSCDSSGTVNYELIYLDSDSRVVCASFSSDYEMSYQIDREKYVASHTEAAISAYSVRVTGPRRVSAKSNISFDVFMEEAAETELRGDAAAENLEKITKTVKVGTLKTTELGEREYNETLAELEGLSADDIEIITSSAYVRITETTPRDGGVNIKGELIITAIIRTEEMTPFAIRRVIPFDELVDITDGDFEDSTADAWVSSLSCKAENGEGGAKVDAEIIMELRAKLYGNEELGVTKDAYHKSRDTDNVYRHFVFDEHILSAAACTELSESFRADDISTASIKDILSLTASFKIKEVEKSRSGVKITADASFGGVACEINEEGEESFSPLKLSRELSFDVNLSCQINDEMSISAKIPSVSCEWRADDGGIVISAPPVINISVSLPKSEKILSECSLRGEEEYVRPSSEISVYYPERDETLFEVAKRFHTSPAEIAADNGISVETVGGAEGTPASAGFTRLIIR